MTDTYRGDIAAEARANENFRSVLFTGEHTQLVVMRIPVGGEIGEEVHEENDQVLTFVDGAGEAQLAGERSPVAAGTMVVVPAGTRHNFLNTGPDPLVLYTVYGPPDHAPDTVHRTKAEADADEHDEPPQEQD